MISSHAVSTQADIDQLPSPCAISQHDHFLRELPRPASTPDIVDSGRISFGGAYRLPLKK